MLKGGMHMNDQVPIFVSLFLFFGCMDLDTRLYAEVIDDIGRKQRDMLLRKRLKNFGMEKPL